MGLFDELGDISEVEQLCREMRENNMKGFDKFTKEINEEIAKVKDANKKKFCQAQMDRIVNHIKEVCDKEYDDLLAQDHKSFRRMWTFVMNHAREFEVNGCAFVSDSVVYGWVDEYVGLDDKAEVEKEMQEKNKSKSEPKYDAKKEIAEIQARIKEESKWEQISIFDLI